MTDIEVLDCYNRCVRAQQEMAASYIHIAVEVPEGQPQVKFDKLSGRWSPRGDVLRCEIGGDERGQPVVTIDDRDFTWEEFGRVVVTHAGWGMRAIFVPDDDIAKTPIIEVQSRTIDVAAAFDIPCWRITQTSPRGALKPSRHLNAKPGRIR